MEYSPSATSDATAPVVTTTANMQPTSVEDLEKRLAVLKAAGVREYVDGGLHVLFERPQPKREKTIDELIVEAEQERIRNGG